MHYINSWYNRLSFQIVLDAEIHSLSFDLENDHSTTSTSDVIRLLVSMEVASRKDLHLVVDYGNGDVRTYGLGDRNLGDETTAKQPVVGNSEIPEITIQGGYGEGCTLVVELQHIYIQEGIYFPIITVHNNHSNLSMELDQCITIQPRLQQITVPLHNMIIAANEPFNLQAVITPNVNNVSLTWNITDLYTSTTNTTHIEPIITDGKRLSHTFVTSSMYRIEVTAKNAVSNVSTQFLLQVELPLSNVELTYDRGRRHVKVGEQVTFHAKVNQGSNVDFEWDFHDSHQGQSQPIYGERISTAVHAFTKPGSYNVSVKAFNPLISSTKTLSQPIIVQEVITNLVLTLPPAVAKSLPVDIVAMVTTGSDVHLDFDFGDGRRPANQKPIDGQVTETHMFESLEIVNITVYAYNEVSAANRSVCMEVQEMIDDITLTKIFKPVLNKQVVFLVKTRGKISV